MSEGFTEANIEDVAMAWFEDLGYAIAFGPDISPDGPSCERQDYDQVVLVERLRSTLERINPDIPSKAIDEALRKVTRTESPGLVENNRRFHRMVTDGVDVSCRDNGRVVHDKA